MRTIMRIIANLIPGLVAWGAVLYGVMVYMRTRDDDPLGISFLLILVLAPLYLVFRLINPVISISDRARREDYCLADVPRLYLFERELLPPVLWLQFPLSALSVPVIYAMNRVRGDLADLVGLVLIDIAALLFVFSGLMLTCVGLCRDASRRNAAFVYTIAGTFAAYFVLVAPVIAAFRFNWGGYPGICAVVLAGGVVLAGYTFRDAVRAVYQFE